MALKQCSKCKEWKELDEVGNDKSTKDGLQRWCKKCRKIYRNNNKEIIKKQKKEYYKNNKEVVKKYRENNKEHIKEIKKEYRENNKNIISLRKKEYYKNYTLWLSIYTEQIKPYEEIRQNGEFLEVKCTYCGKWYKPKKLELKSRLGSINGNLRGESRFYCSMECKGSCSIFHKKKWPKEFKINTSREVQPELRKMVLERDNYTCQKCNKHQIELKVGLHCHHKEGIYQNPIESADMDMCITYCKNCHKLEHKLPGMTAKDLRCSTKTYIYIKRI